MDSLNDILFIYLIVVLIWLIVASFTLISIIKNKDHGRLWKIFWCAVVIIAPVLGLIVYLVYSYDKERRV